MDVQQTDSIDGRSPERQALIAGVNLGLVTLSWHVIAYLQFFLISIALRDTDPAYSYLDSGWHRPVTILLCGLLWGLVFFKAGLGWVSVEGNKIVPSLNMLFPSQTDNGGTRYIIYTGGFSLAYLWEQLFDPVDVEREQVHKHCEDITISIGRIALKIRIMLVWRPLLKRLSHFLQNGLDQADREHILDALLAQAGQLAETTASSSKHPVTNLPFGESAWKVEEVRANQDKIASAIRDGLEEKATSYGFEMDNVIFEKCDYSKEVQDQFDKKAQAEVVDEIARGIIQNAKDSGNPIDPSVAYDLACILSEKKGVTRDRTILELAGDPEFLKNLASTAPAIAAALAAWKNRGGKGRSNNNQDNKGPDNQ